MQNQQTKRRKKRVLPVQATKTVTVVRGKNGYGFTISGQNPCILSCIVSGSPAHSAGLRAGDLLYFLNGQNVSRACHDDVVRMVGLSTGSLELQVAENYNSSDSSDDDYLPRTKSRYPNRFRSRHGHTERAFKHPHISHSCPTLKQNYSEDYDQENSLGEQSAFSSGSTSQDDQAWGIPAHVLQHRHCQARPSKKHHHIRDAGKLMAYSNMYSQTVTSTAKRISSAIVKRVPPVSDSGKHFTPNGSEHHKHAGINQQSQVCLGIFQGDSKVKVGSQLSKQSPSIEAVVGYIGSIEMASSSTHPHQRLQALRNTVRRLRLEKRVHTLVLMEVRQSGVVLTNSMGKQLALYPSNRIAFSGVCPDDGRFFGLVTLCSQESSSDLGDGEILKQPNSTCHIFKIDPDMSLHSSHIQLAQSFQVDCKTNPHTGECNQFPKSATPLVLFVANLYRNRPQSRFHNDIVEAQVLADPASSSDSDCLEPGLDELSFEQREQVCVVELSNGREQLDTSILSGLVHSTSSDESPVVKKQSPQVIPDTDCLKLPKSNHSEHSPLVKSMREIKKSMQLLEEDQNIMLGNNEVKVEHKISPTMTTGGHTPFRTNNSELVQTFDYKFAVPTNPPPVSIHHSVGRSAFHLLRSTSAPIEKQCSAETIDLNIIDKLSPRAFPHSPSTVCFRSPSAPPTPFFPHRDSDDEKDEDDESEDDPYICQILEQFNRNNIKPAGTDIRRNSQKNLVSAQKWTKMGSFRKTDKKNLKQSFSQSLESLAVGDNAGTNSHKLMTACSVHNIAGQTHNQDIEANAGRVASWAVHIDKLLQDPFGIDAFTEFLKREFSDENIRFWRICQQFKNLTIQQQKTQAKDIYTKYLSAKASDPVNVDNAARLYTEKFLENPQVIMFDMAQHQIWQLMRQDSYPRFLKSDLYKNMLLEEMGEGRLQGHEHQFEEKSAQKKHSGKENGGRRRRSILLWKRKVASDCELNKKSTSKFSNNSNQLNVNASSQDTPATVGSTVKKAAGIGIDLSTMRKEVFQQKETHGCSESLVKFCRIIMPDGSTTVVCAKPGQTSHAVLRKLCEKRSINIGSVDVFLVGSDKPLNLNEDISTLGSKEIVLEKRVLFRLDLPYGKSVEVKAKPQRSVRNVLKPILDKYGYNIDSTVVHMAPCKEVIDLEMTASELDNQRILITTNTPGSQKRKVPLFGRFRTSEKRINEKRKHQGQSDLLSSNKC